MTYKTQHSLFGRVLTVAYELPLCTYCELPMLPSSLHILVENVAQEHYQHHGICNQCVKEGKYIVRCALCDTQGLYESFAIQLEHYANYSDDEAYSTYICKACVISRADQVIREMLSANDVKGL